MPVLTSDIGLSIEVPDAFAEVPDLEVGSVCLVARVEPWTRLEDFCPTVTVEVDGLASDRATIPALSLVTIDAQVALGRHVIACDVWMTGESATPDEDAGRRIVCTYRAMSGTIVQQQYVVVRGGRAVAITVQCEPGHLRAARQAFDVAAATLRVTFNDPPVPAADRVAPRLDAFIRDVLAEPLALEDLSPIRDAEPFRTPRPDLSEDQLKALRRGKLRGSTDAVALQAHRFVGEERRRTELGRTVHDVFKRPIRRLTVQVSADGAPRSATFEAALTPETGVIVATLSRGDAAPRSGVSVEAIDTWAVADGLVRCLGVAPAWTISIAAGDEKERIVPAAVLDARLADPAASPPDDANPALTRLWGLPWEHVTLNSTRRGSELVEVVTTTEAGSFGLRRDSAAGAASLTPLPSYNYLRLLLSFCGFEV